MPVRFVKVNNAEERGKVLLITTPGPGDPWDSGTHEQELASSMHSLMPFAKMNRRLWVRKQLVVKRERKGD